ncbi:Calcineurin-like phosphoesterase [Bremerella volcania]|uniref:Calcineurin-like phosphoesterase n=1 Tax=Bremerella volcania TaxID=2527984 RepID=A0A518CC12_9BACT|nr:metallophosphoesterase [Bremerella volcania]QDU76762.1 Calcineurin-like phosphoesterase [Bremerella volcania]
MGNSNRRYALLLVVLFAACFATQAMSAEFLVISDIHFQPFTGLNREQFKHLASLPASQWPEFLASSNHSLGTTGSDSNYLLMTSALDAAKSHTPRPLFILYPGDFLAHQWQEYYEKLALRSIADDPEAYQAFTMKAIEVVAAELRKRYPDVPVLATLGNDDSFCGDYWIQPDGAFLHQFASRWQPMLGDTIDAEPFRQSFPSLGAYRADLPGMSSDRLLVLNSVYWSGSYCSSYFDPKDQNCCQCQNPDARPGHAQMDWLESELELARKQQKRVWLLMHVPPGLDSYLEDKSGGRSLAAEMWQPEFMRRYLKLVERYHDILHVSFTGHTHMDDFRIDRPNEKPVLLHKVAPAISPIFGNNPGFQAFEVDPETGIISNWKTYSLDLTHSTTSSKWRLEYENRTTYQLESLNAESAEQLFRFMHAHPDSGFASAYRKHYGMGAFTIPEKDLPFYLCTILNATYPQFAACLQQHGLAQPQQADEPAQVRRHAGGMSGM